MQKPPLANNEREEVTHQPVLPPSIPTGLETMLAFHSLPLPLSSPREQSQTVRWVRMSAPALPPRRIGAVAKDMQAALQDCLRARRSRLEIALPPGARLGTEKRPDDIDARGRRVASNRELGRLLAGMFEGTGLSCRVIFGSVSEKETAKKAWGPLVECAFDHWEGVGRGGATGRGAGGEEPAKRKSRQKKSGFTKTSVQPKGGFSRDSSPAAEDVYIIVGPSPAQMSQVRALSDALGQDKLVLLANADIYSNSESSVPIDITRYVADSFESAYFYTPNPHPSWSGGVLFRKFPNDWVLCRQPPVGLLQKLLVSEEKPSLDEIARALKEEGEKPESGLFNAVSSFLGGGKKK